ncbi:MAG: FAD-dependent oxidoreductase [Thermoproteales archaeon]|nr:FAD-dependent oxidoreductase [Thermoproteales archaeon]
MTKVIVIGGGPAGMSAASRIKRLKPEYNVTVFEKSNYVSYGQCGIPYYVGGIVKNLEDLVHYSKEYFINKRKINVFTRTEVVDIGEGYVISKNDGGEKKFNWDILVLATGARPIVPPIKGINLEGIITVRTLEDAEICKKLSLKAENVGVVGGGYIGLEMAENFIKLGKKTYLFEMLPHVLPNIDSDMSWLIESELKKRGVELHLSEKVIGFEGEKKVEKIITEKGEYKIDLVIMAVGVRPDNSLAKKLGLKLGVKGAVSVDEYTRTSNENVYAVGDIAETFDIVTGNKTWVPLATTANKMGYVAGSNIGGKSIKFPGIVGTAITKIFDLEVGRTGLSEEQSKMLNIETVTTKIKAKTRPTYYPGGGEITIKLIADKEGRLLGGQFIGRDVLPRLNALASLLFKKSTVWDAFFDDLAYSPVFAPVWDPLVAAGRVLLRNF